LEADHDAPDRAEQADVGRVRTDVGEEFEVVFEAVGLARELRAHRPLRAFELRARIDAALLPLPRELAETDLENRLEPDDAAVLGGRIAEQRRQIGTGPETLLEFVG